MFMNLIQAFSKCILAKGQETSNYVHNNEEEQSVLASSARFRDSIFEEAELLFPTY